MDKLGQIIGVLGGKKFLVTILGMVAVLLNKKMGVDIETTLTIGGFVVTYIVMQAKLDTATGGITSNMTGEVDLAELKRIALATEIEKSRQLELQVEKAKATAVPPAVPLEQQIIDAAVAKQVRKDIA